MLAAYCRVSTDSDEQLTSYEAQVEHYTASIKQNPQWEFAGIYADEGISGTNTKKRLEFNKLIDDYMAGKIDMVITKSISRFARNTLDCLQYIRQLKDKSIPVFFEKENINTMDSKGEILLTIMSSLAQEESRSLSTNVKWGLTHRFQNGEVMVNHNRFLGYTKDEDGKLIIDPDGAEVVKRIYREYLEGASLFDIGKGVQEELVRRANLYDSSTGGKRVYSSKFALSSIVFCGECGEIYRRVHWNNRGKKSVVWRCVSRLEEKGDDCSSPTINEDALQNAVIKAINQVISGRNGFIATLLKNIDTALDATLDEGTDDIDTKLGELQNELLHYVELNSRAGASNTKYDVEYEALANSIRELRSQRQSIVENSAEREGKRQRIAEMTKFLQNQSGEITEYDDKLVRQLVERITVFEDKLEIEFKSSVEIDVAI